MRQLSDLSGILRSAYDFAYKGQYDRARNVLAEALNVLRHYNGERSGVDEDILETCLAWVEEAAATFTEGPAALRSRARLQA